ncbi:MAG: hypothetical protein NWS22_09275, partial [Porticoccaceae bacterium]|nr:hypothetical protein [Porticoccaceae bacterium]
HSIHNAGVGGSSPPVATNIYHLIQGVTKQTTPESEEITPPFSPGQRQGNSREKIGPLAQQSC